MHPTIRQMDAVNSGTGVFYQAMPAVGADGKNIMKLIPVQMVNGQFVRIETSKPKMAPTPQKAVTIDIAPGAFQMVKEAALNTSASQLLRKQASLVNQADLNVRNLTNKRPLLQPSVNSMTKVPQMATPTTNCVSEAVTIPSQLPVTVKSPALPRGQYLQIPPNAQIQTVSASELPPGVKKQIFTSSANSSPGLGAPNVVYVSPITTVDQGRTLPNYPALNLLELLSKKSASTSCGPPLKPQLKLIPQVSQSPNSPIKWMIEEEDSSAAQALDTLNSPSVTSEILRAVAVRETTHKSCDSMTKPASQLSQSESRQEEENALVMCNGKVFFVAKKCNLPVPVGTDDSPTVATKNTTVPSPAPTSDIQQIIIPDESDEVIDLCDDDDSSQQAVDTAAVTHLDEDNVIFVSYIPPKSDCGSAQRLILQTPKALTKVTDQRGTSNSDSMRHQKRLHPNAGDDALRRRESCKSTLVSTVQNHIHARGPAVINTVGSNDSSQQSTSIQHVGCLEVDIERENQAYPRTSDGSSGTCSQVEENSLSTAAGLTSLPASKSHLMADHLLRQVFGITADVKICLQRIDEASAGSVPAEPLQSESIRSVEDHQEAMRKSKEDKLFLQDFSSPQKNDSSNRLVKRVKVLTEQELPAEPATPGPHTHLQCSHLEQRKTFKRDSGQKSLKGTPCDVEMKPLIDCYLEPIDEDFLSAGENNPTDAHPQTCVNLNINSRRMGRTRKRTFCPCCITGTHDTATKSSVKSEELEKLMTEQTSKRGGRTKSVRKDVRTSGRTSWLKARNKQNCQTYEAPDSERFSTTSMDPEDPEELQRLEQIRRLKELLREKEFALDLMRNSMS